MLRTDLTLVLCLGLNDLTLGTGLRFAVPSPLADAK
jgi:hypothetical protein